MYKKRIAQFIFFFSKNITFYFQNSAGQVKIKLHSTISNGF